MFSGASVYSTGGGRDVTSCLVPCSFQGVSAPTGVSGPVRGGVGTPCVLTSSGNYCRGQYTFYWYSFLYNSCDFIPEIPLNLAETDTDHIFNDCLLSPSP